MRDAAARNIRVAARCRSRLEHTTSRAAGGARKRRLQRGVLELLERTNLDFHASRLRGEPTLFLGKRIDALALGLGRYGGRRDLEKSWHREKTRAFLADRTGDGLLQRLENGTRTLRVDARVRRDMADEPRLRQRL